MEIHISKDTTTLNHDLAKYIHDYIHTVLKQKERFTFVLSGGSTPKNLYQLLSAEPYKSSIPWQKIHFFWGDERFVAFEDDRNNAKMAFVELLNKVDVVSSQIHIFKTDISPEESVLNYTQILQNYFDGEGATFDLVLLGMGDDGHTLSLFPRTEVIKEEKGWVSAFYLKAQDMFRITLTAPIVNQANAVVFAVTGTGKAIALKEVLQGEKNLNQYPSQIIKPTGELHWFIDEDAAKLLS